jgi:hypothetical protein
MRVKLLMIFEASVSECLCNTVEYSRLLHPCEVNCVVCLEI